ncbi:ubiquinol-cytochrome C chaperone family protein [Bradyrhizobium sp. LHD-71]|uniref:ubiquinol-cytochrome C chaperone family protein n=1 Tax=Bradyrhizobium sp. LHD-71 TaxID=3072141 RepID=UPI00280F722F|nr:ubiquinol-cytochrome C chaperone family protein [Bradyrhizobium sp. LHD-71]MDQ8726138.1 ubiquinol-cytochrome C chaperone family protein [Bradyrhizobium sp. LHD-71]
MLWPFNRSPGPTIEAIYGMIVAQARLPAFYERIHVPDTVNGRFDMVLLHLWMVLRRLKTCAGGAKASQALLDHFCSDMDANLREMGVGDLTVPKRILKFAEAFYGRANAYDAALQAGGPDLPQALGRNILLDSDAARAEPLAAYVRKTIRHLEAVDERRLLAGEWTFADPATMAQTHEAVS